MTVKTKDQQSFYMRFHRVDVYSALLDKCAATHQPMREIVERACRFAFSSKDFVVPVKETTADKLNAARERKLDRLKEKSDKTDSYVPPKTEPPA